MAFFKFRKGGDDQPTPAAAAPESVEAMRKRAMHRLIGAALLVILGVIGFPLLFDSQPRPISVDIPIEIPDKNKVKPLGNLPIDAVPAQTSGVVESEVVVASGASAPAAPEPVASAPVTASSAAVAPAKTEKDEKPVKSEKPPVAPVKLAASAPTPIKSDDGKKAQALLEGKEASVKPAPTEARFVVQVGAFADAAKAREARAKLEKAGLKTYTQVAETKDGPRIRVRVGPFGTRAEADKATDKIKKIDLAATILEL